ncbi:Endoglucanase precursor [compost metagenome]
MAPSGFSAAMLPFLHAQGDEEAAQAQQTRIQDQPLRPTAYYEQCLALFGLGWMQQQFRFGRLGEFQPRWITQP